MTLEGKQESNIPRKPSQDEVNKLILESLITLLALSSEATGVKIEGVKRLVEMVDRL